jgi:hypothetical protein
VRPPKMAHHDRSHYLRTSMAPGLGYPIHYLNSAPKNIIRRKAKM